MSIGVALIGSGIFAKEEHLPAILSSPHLTLRAIYSRTHASASTLASAQNHPQPTVYSDDGGDGNPSYADLLASASIAAVVIALPIPNQPKYIKQALEAGKHVLSEKPVAENVAGGRELVEWYERRVEAGEKETWGVAENFRYMERFSWGGAVVGRLGRVVGWRVRVDLMVEKGGKYYETSWRKDPTYQGGFLLDGGVHFIAGTRALLGPSNPITRVSAFTSQLQPHLPPIDNVSATCQLGSGVSGTISISFGTTFKGSEYAVACENGTVRVVGDEVIVERDGKEETKKFEGDGNGVMQEVKAWAEGLVNGEVDPRQAPEEALKDLMVLEAMLKSGERNGEPVDTGV